MRIDALVAAAGVAVLQLGAATAANAQERSSLSAAQCASLTGETIPAVQIMLPTSGARITKAAMVAAAAPGQGPTPGHPDYCLVVGEIAPIDRTAPDIEFNVGLPAGWNGKAFMLGGGGFDGFVPDVTGTPYTAERGLTPLARGYAVFSSDSGHKSSGPPLALDASFALNREALLNWEGDALKKTHDAALAVIKQAYGRGTAAAYFAGGSGGGRQALMAAARWPADWNGVIALYPARDGVALALQALRTSQALAAPGA